MRLCNHHVITFWFAVALLQNCFGTSIIRWCARHHTLSFLLFFLPFLMHAGCSRRRISSLLLAWFIVYVLFSIFISDYLVGWWFKKRKRERKGYERTRRRMDSSPIDPTTDRRFLRISVRATVRYVYRLAAYRTASSSLSGSRPHHPPLHDMYARRIDHSGLTRL